MRQQQVWHKDSLHQRTPPLLLPLFAAQAHSWIKVQARIYYPQPVWAFWDMDVLTIIFLQNGKEIKRAQARPANFIEAGSWQNIDIETAVPHAADHIDVYLGEGKHTQALYLDDWRISQLFCQP